ncbi:MAG: GDP-mannose 4,6-dehydratase [Candidatus Nealsonbacteria bacterium]
MNKKILITGGAGFQGSHLIDYFSGLDCEVTILNTFSEKNEGNLKGLNVMPRVVWGSVTDAEIVNKTIRGQDVVLHLAAHINVDESILNPKLTLDVNIQGTYNVLEAVRKHKNKLIHTSTCEVYGEPVNKKLIDEITELRPHSPYAASKAAADRLCFAYFKTYGIDVTVIRPFNVFGPRQKEKDFGAFIPMSVKKAMDGQNLQVFGKGTQTRDYMYIDDLVRAYGLVVGLEKTAGEVYNFGTGVETSVKDIAEYIAKKFGVGVDYLPARPGEVARFCADITKAKKLGFEPKINIWEGIDKYILWRSQNSIQST